MMYRRSRIGLVVLIAVCAVYIYTSTKESYLNQKLRCESKNVEEKTVDEDVEHDPSTRSKSLPDKLANKGMAMVELDRIESWYRNYTTVDRLLNMHKFVFQHDSKACEDHVDVIIFVHSATRHFDRRNVIRNTWGAIQRIGAIAVATVFMLGQTINATEQEQISRESYTHGDIVQGNFIDSYRNLTYKHIMAYYWIVRKCPTTRNVLKVDDDVLVDIFKLPTLWNYNCIHCLVYESRRPFRNQKSKWYISRKEYPYEKYHDYCNGPAYSTTMDVVKRMLGSSKFTRFFWVDDVYITGALRRMVGADIKSFSNIHSTVVNINYKHSMFYIRFFEEWATIWRNLLANNKISFG